mmetsp:Transcript_19112/g.38995  ORF Transcript_19112/g.38995 Transcript_19112/m.38995 type:complete len:390 (-) Transcript_19112:1396-2565(-)
MLILFETTFGYALIRKKLNRKRGQRLQLHSFLEYKNKKESIKSISKVIKGQVDKTLKKFLKNNASPRDSLIVNNRKMKIALIKKSGLSFPRILLKQSIFREIRANMEKIFEKNQIFQDHAKTLSIAHAIYGYKIKINGAKTDNTIIHTIRILDELDKEINNYSVRLKEWYSWHFPELGSIVTDRIVYAEIILRIETRDNLKLVDLSEIIHNDIQKEITEASETSLGVGIFQEDLLCILSLCNQIIAFEKFKKKLQEYLKNRMYSVAPNLTALIGERLGGQFITHTGSLINLAKSPASSVQIYGAEKALFRAIKMRTKTPKYGIIFNSGLVAKSDPRLKGKISRILSGKIVLSARIDALGEFKYGGSIGLKNKNKIEQRLIQFRSFVFKK